MNDRFSFFDVIAYIIPGVILLPLVFRTLHFYLHIPNLQIGFFLQWYGVILIILLSYIIGHLIQAIAKCLFSRRLYFSNSILLNSDTSFSAIKKAQILITFSKIFDNNFLTEAINAKNRDKEDKSADKLIREAFDLVYTLINQRNASVSSEIFISLYYFCQGMVVVSLLWFLDSICELLLRRPMIQSTLNDFSSPIVSWIILFCSLLSFLLFYSRARYFSKHFADSVYRSFLCLSAKVVI